MSLTLTGECTDFRIIVMHGHGICSAEQRRKRAEEKAARELAATAEQGCGALASAAIEIIEHPALKPRRIPSRSWRELIKKVWEVDPLQCPYDIPASSRDAPRAADQ